MRTSSPDRRWTLPARARRDGDALLAVAFSEVKTSSRRTTITTRTDSYVTFDGRGRAETVVRTTARASGPSACRPDAKLLTLQCSDAGVLTGMHEARLYQDAARGGGGPRGPRSTPRPGSPTIYLWIRSLIQL